MSSVPFMAAFSVLIQWSSLLAQGGAGDPRNAPKGLVCNKDGACEGYTLFAPLQSTTTYLIDMDGEVVNSWKSEYTPGSPYLLPNGHLLRSADDPTAPRFRAGGKNGRIQEFTWEGELIWDYKFADEMKQQHHDIAPMQNGHVLFIAWEYKTKEEAIAAGRDPTLVGDEGMWPDCVFEVKPVDPDSAEIVWEWRVFDHLVQDFDPEKANHGDVAAHLELVDINADREGEPITAAERDRLIALGYITQAAPPPRPGGPGGGPPEGRADWNHTNAINYNEELDQIALSIHHFSEIWIIDHSTTTEEAKGHEGGRCGKGGDLLYRWGNPRRHRAGDKSDQKLFSQHDVRWIPAGYPGEGNLMVFNNGRGRAEGDFSSVDEIVTPIGMDLTYLWETGEPFDPPIAEWTYQSPDPKEFFSSFISGAHRLPNGNTFICSGAQGRLFEVTGGGEIVWEYWNPHFDADMQDRGPRGRLPPPGPGGPPPRDPQNPDGNSGPGGPPPGPDDQAGRNRGNGPPPLPPGMGRGGFVGTGCFRATRIPADYPGLAKFKGAGSR